MTTFGILLIFFFIFSIIIILQSLILKRSYIRYGLIIPVISFFVSIIIEFILAINGIKEKDIPVVVLFFFILNIPTVITLLMMYIKNGKNKQKKLEEEKSKIKDLE